MPIRTHREATYAAPKPVVWQAIVDVVPGAAGAVADENPALGTIAFDHGAAASNRSTFTVTEVNGGTHVRVDREIQRGYGHGMWDLFDFFGQEAQKWLFLVQQRIVSMHAAQPWGAAPPSTPAGVVPGPLAVGARVAVVDPATRTPREGVVRGVAAGRYDVVFADGSSGWYDAHDVHAERA